MWCDGKIKTKLSCSFKKVILMYLFFTYLIVSRFFVFFPSEIVTTYDDNLS